MLYAERPIIKIGYTPNVQKRRGEEKRGRGEERRKRKNLLIMESERNVSNFVRET